VLFILPPSPFPQTLPLPPFRLRFLGFPLCVGSHLPLAFTVTPPCVKNPPFVRGKTIPFPFSRPPFSFGFFWVTSVQARLAFPLALVEFIVFSSFSPPRSNFPNFSWIVLTLDSDFKVSLSCLFYLLFPIFFSSWLSRLFPPPSKVPSSPSSKVPRPPTTPRLRRFPSVLFYAPLHNFFSCTLKSPAPFPGSCSLKVLTPVPLLFPQAGGVLLLGQP